MRFDLSSARAATRDLLHALEETPARLAHRQKALSRRASSAKDRGQERIWDVQTRALERVETWLDEAPSALAPVLNVAEKLVDRRLAALTAVPVEGYEELNAKEAMRAIRGLEGRVALRVVQKFEAEHKKRKSVLALLDERLARAARAGSAEQPAQAEPQPGA